MKKSFFLFAALLTSFGICAAERGVVNADKLNLRQGPSFKSPVVGRCVRNDEVTILRVMGNWAELELPANLPVYISESRLQHGKTISEVNLRSRAAASAPSLGILPAGTEVKVLKLEKFGWVRIAPPEGFKVYTAKMYLAFDEKKLEKASIPVVTPAVEKKAEPAAPAVEKKAEPAAPAVEKKAEPAAPAVEKKAEPAAPEKELIPPAVPEAAAPAVKPVAAAKAAVPVVPQAAVAVPAEKSVPAVSLEAPWNAEFARLGVDLQKSPEAVSRKGVLTKLNFSQNPVTKYALLDGEKGKNLAFVCAKDGSVLAAGEGKKVLVSGDAYQLPGGSVPVIFLKTMQEEK